MFRGMVELDPAARHPRMVAALAADVGIGGKLLPRLVDLAVADEGEPREDQRLRARPALGEPAVDEQLVGALLRHHSSSVIARSGATKQSRVAQTALDCFAALAMKIGRASCRERVCQYV